MRKLLLRQMETLNEQKPATHSLSGKVVLIITGYDEGGRSLALSMAERGANLALLSHPDNEAGAWKIKREVAQYENVQCQVFQLSQPEDAQRTIRHVIKEMGSIDILLDCSRAGNGN